MSESLQWALLMPLIVALLLGTIGISLWLRGRSAVQEAAFAGAEAGAIWHGDTGQAEAAARQVLGDKRLVDQGFHDIHIEVSTSGDEITVYVSAVVSTFLPDGSDPVVHGRATRTKEA